MQWRITPSRTGDHWRSSTPCSSWSYPPETFDFLYDVEFSRRRSYPPETESGGMGGRIRSFALGSIEENVVIGPPQSTGPLQETGRGITRHRRRVGSEGSMDQDVDPPAPDDQ